MRRAALGMALLVAACSKNEPPRAHATVPEPPPAGAPSPAPAGPSATPAPSSDSAAPGERLPAKELTWSYDETPVGRMSVVVLLPERPADERFPVLIALHGRGEALKGPERGARGWVDDYDLLHAVERLHHPPLVNEDLLSFVTAARLEELNRALSEAPYRGLIVVCPYMPDMLRGDDPFSKAPPLERFLVEDLLPRVYRETPALGTAQTTGIDGVSLGGRGAISVGLLRPEAFSAIAGLQAAFDVENAPEFAARAREARAKNPRLTFRLVTSHDDYFLLANRAMTDAARAAGVPVDYRVLPGPHDYAFNRGPGAYEMLLFHDRVLRGKSPP